MESQNEERRHFGHADVVDEEGRKGRQRAANTDMHHCMKPVSWTRQSAATIARIVENRQEEKRTDDWHLENSADRQTSDGEILIRRDSVGGM